MKIVTVTMPRALAERVCEILTEFDADQNHFLAHDGLDGDEKEERRLRQAVAAADRAHGLIHKALRSPQDRAAIKPRAPKSNLFLARATNVTGEREFGVEFLLTARTQQAAHRKAESNLRNEWGKPDRREPGDRESGVIATFFGCEILVKDLSVNPITPEDALKHFTRGG